MSFYKEVPGRKTTLESTLKFDTEPKAGSTNPVTSEGVKSAIDGAVGDAAEVLQEQIDDIAEKAGSGYTPKGEASVATLNGLSGQENGELYTMTDAGTLTDGSLAVVAGDTVAWDATNSVWYKAMDYVPRQYGTNEVHNLATTITAFRTGDYIAVDGTDTAKMSKDDLLSIIDRMKSGGYNYTSGFYLSTSGNLVENASYGVSDCVKVKNGDVVHFVSGSNSTSICLCVYDEQMNFITYYRNNEAGDRSVTISNASAKYVRSSFAISSSSATIDVNGISSWVPKKYLATIEGLDTLNLYIFGGKNYKDGVYLDANGDYVENVNWRVSAYIQASKDDEVVWNIGSSYSSSATLCMYDENLNYLGRYVANASERDFTLTTNGVAFIRASVRIDNSDASVTINGDVKWKPEQTKGINDNLSTIQKRLDGGVNYEDGYITTDGSVISRGSWVHTDYIEVKDEDTVHVFYGVQKGDAVIAVYDSNYNFLTSYNCSNTERTFTIRRANARYIRASVNLSYNAVKVKVNGNLLWTPSVIEKTDVQTNYNTTSIKVLSDKVLSGVNYTDGYKLNASGVEGTNSSWMISDFVPVSNGDIVYWYAGQQVGDICAVSYDINKNFIASYPNSDGVSTQITISDPNVKYVRASVRNDNKDICIKINGVVAWVPQSIPRVEDYLVNPEIVRIATYNVGEFEGRGMETGSQDVAMAMRKAISEANVTLLAVQEDVSYFNSLTQTTSRDECFANFKFYERKGSQRYNYKSFCSDRNMGLIRKLDYTGAEFSHSYFLAGERIFGGKSVMLVCVHLDWQDNTRRQMQIAQVIDFCANYENAIVAGDFNPSNYINGEKQYTPGDYETMDTSDADCALFTSAGFRLGNNGYWGKLGTYDSIVRDGYPWPCDNIVVKGNVYIHNVGVVAKEYMNDHYIFYADISIG